MKILLLSITLFLIQSLAFARDIHSLPSRDAQASVARVVDLVKLVDKPGIQVKIIVTDLGGSTDVSPTQQMFFSLYAKGEMFSTDAAFDLGYIYAFHSAKRLSGGVYEVKYSGPDEETSMPVDKTLIIDAQDAIMDIKEVACDDFDCDASTNFKTVIKVRH